MAVDLKILGVEGVSLTVPNITLPDHGGQFAPLPPEKVMHQAKKRYAEQGAEQITLIPNRDGNGWKKKNEADA